MGNVSFLWRSLNKVVFLSLKNWRNIWQRFIKSWVMWKRWMGADWSISPMRKGWESCGFSAWRTEGSGRSYSSLPLTKGGLQKTGEGLFTRAYSDRTRGNGFKLKEGRFRLDLRKKFFTMRVVRCWNRLRREVVDAPSLAVFKARFDGALSTLV